MLYISFSAHNGVRGFLHFKKLHCCTTCQATAGSHVPISDIQNLWKWDTSVPIDLNHKLGSVLFICWYCLVFNPAQFWQPCPIHLFFFPHGRVRAYVISGRCLVGPYFCVFRIQTKSRKQNGVSSSERLLAVYDELIISEMSVVMKIGHLQEATQFTVTEVFTFLVTPSSSRLYTPLLKDGELRADATTLHAYKDYSCFISHVLILFLNSRNAFGCRRKYKQTIFMKHMHPQHTHTCVKGGRSLWCCHRCNKHSFISMLAEC